MEKYAPSTVIPFFTLGANVLPGEPLPLHIFEPRYQQMVKYCLGENELHRPVPFGVSMIRAKIIQPVGCLVNISSVVRKFKDGRSIVLTFGESRYRLLEVLNDGPFPQARVRFIEDLDEDIDLKLQAEVVRLFEQAVKLELAGNNVAAASELLSFQFATRLNLEQAERQEILNQPSEQARLEKLKDVIAFQTMSATHAAPMRVHSYIQ